VDGLSARTGALCHNSQAAISRLPVIFVTPIADILDFRQYSLTLQSFILNTSTSVADLLE
jgi:hypothetical protein